MCQPKPVQTALATLTLNCLKGFFLAFLMLFASFVATPQVVKGSGIESPLLIETLGGGGYVECVQSKALTPKLDANGTVEIEISCAGLPFLMDATILDQGGSLNVRVVGPMPNCPIEIGKIVLRRGNGEEHSSYRVLVSAGGGVGVLEMGFVR